MTGQDNAPPAEDAHDSKAEIRARLLAAQDMDGDWWKRCPVRPLGCSKGMYFFVSRMGEQREVRFNEFTHKGILSLFEGETEWLEEIFPNTNKRGKETGGFDVDEVAAFLMAACSKQGLYNETLQIRQAGVWREDYPENGGLPRLIVHCGDSLFLGKDRLPAGQRIGNALYESATKIAYPADEPATPADVQFLVETLQSWTYGRGDLDVELMTGWIGQAMLGAGPSWRVHMMVTGHYGSGKSMLASAVSSTLGAAAHDIKNNFSEGGLRQSLTKMARTMLLDEAEPEEGESRVQRVIELLRHMAGGDGSRAVRGSPGGSAQQFNITGCAYLSSILHVPLKPQDKSRIVHVTLNPLIVKRSAQEMEDRLRRLGQISPRFRRRMIDGWERFTGTYISYKSAFMDKGLDSRAADQLGTLYAGRDILMNDVMVTTDGIAEDVARAALMIEELKERETEENEGQLCLNHLYSSIAEAWQGGHRMTVGQLLAEAISSNDKLKNRQLGTWGIRFDPPEFESGSTKSPAVVVIANVSQGLEKIFTNTRWAGGVWRQALHFAGCTQSKKPYRFAGVVAKGSIVPAKLWPEGDE